MLNPATGKCILLKTAIAKGIIKIQGDKTKSKSPPPNKKIVKSPKINNNNTPQLSVFIYMMKDFNLGTTIYFKEIIFMKYGNKVEIEVISGRDDIADEDMGVMNIVMSYDMLMKHEYLRKYYELSLAAIGKPNVDPDYYGIADPANPNPNLIFIDAMYIVEDSLTHNIIAKKGNRYHPFNLKQLIKTRVSDDANIEEFNTNYDMKYGFENADFEERTALYTKFVKNHIAYLLS